MKRKGPGHGRGASRRKSRPGRRERGAERGRKGAAAGPRGPGPGVRAREGIVREAGPPSAAGQRLGVEDREGRRWQVECLGEAVEVGARIDFEALEPTSAARGQLIRVRSAPRTSWVARVRRVGTQLDLLPFGGVEAPELALAERASKGAEDGDRVIVAPLTDKQAARGSGARRAGRGRGGRSGLPVRVLEVLGPAGDATADFRALAWKHRLPLTFTRRARLEAEGLPSEWSRETLERRTDLRHLAFVTIDPATARDHDDAVFAEVRPAEPSLRVESGAESGGPRASAKGLRRAGGGFSQRLWVAIADVGHFVEPGGWIDAEARRRGNSFYFPDRAIPMLPERLSSDLCSLRPNVDRLAMVAELRLDALGRVVDALFHEAVIRSRARLSYQEAADFLDSNTVDPGSSDRDAEPEWAESLRRLDAIAQSLGGARAEAGALMLELPEIEVVVDDTGRAVDARVRGRNRAHVLIEEAMLAANRAVARALDAAGRPTIHRVHAPPDASRLAQLRQRFERHGVDLPEEIERPGVLAEALAAVRGDPAEERLHEAVLRAMSQARYEAESRGHYALRFEHYLHFTSPIRRYADLEVHRALRRLIRGEREVVAGGSRESGAAGRPDESLVRLAAWLSGRERVAVDAERDAEALAACAMMTGREGERFEAKVMAATSFGLFVRLVSPAVNGLVPMRSLEGRWEVDELEESIVAERSGARISVGDTLRVRLLEIDPDRARLAFRIDPEKGTTGRRAGRTRRH